MLIHSVFKGVKVCMLHENEAAPLYAYNVLIKMLSVNRILLKAVNECHHSMFWLSHWGRVTHICVSKQTIIGSDNGLSPGRRQAIIWTNAGILLIGSLGTNFSEISIEIRIFSFKKVGLKVSSAKRRPFCLGLNVLKCMHYIHDDFMIWKRLPRCEPFVRGIHQWSKGQ